MVAARPARGNRSVNRPGCDRSCLRRGTHRTAVAVREAVIRARAGNAWIRPTPAGLGPKTNPMRNSIEIALCLCLHRRPRLHALA
jgi:hypothetical protein